MSAQKRGLQKEHELAKEIFEESDGKVIPIRCGYSGNQALPSPDLLIPFNGSLRAVELKSTKKDRVRIEEDAITDIRWWAQHMTEVPTVPYLAVMFNRRQIHIRPLRRVSNTRKTFEHFSEESPLPTHVTDGEALIVEKPSTNIWPSKTASVGNAQHVLEVFEAEENPPATTEILRLLDDPEQRMKKSGW